MKAANMYFDKTGMTRVVSWAYPNYPKDDKKSLAIFGFRLGEGDEISGELLEAQIIPIKSKMTLEGLTKWN